MKQVLILMVRAYQMLSRSVAASPILFGEFSGCRSSPTCSDYAIEVLRRDGALKGSAKAVARVARCNPLWPAQRHG